MQASGRLLFGDDGSVGADLGWLWIHEQAWDGWELAQLSAIVPPPGAVIPHERSSAHENPLGPTRTSFAEAGFVARHALLAESDPRIALMDDADADLVVVGSTGHRFGPDRLGSTAEWLLRNSPKPMVIARNGRAVRQVLICADATDPSLRAVDGLVKMPWIDDAAIVVLAVDDAGNEIDAALAATREALGRHAAGAREIVKAGEASPIILDVAAADAADLIVLGTRGRGGLERLVLGSTAAAVSRHARASVLTSR